MSTPSWPDRNIDDLYVWLSVDPSNEKEGIMAFNMGGVPMPVVASNLSTMERKEVLTSVKNLSKSQGFNARLVRFERKESLIEIFHTQDNH